MATITTDTFLDGGVARTAGETWTINSGATLTIRTDTRWHANAPASMTGSLGNISATTNSGNTKFDGSKVRWMPFDTGSGTVPAIGTTITQGGISGYLLGVWADYTSAPTAVGAAMPATGYIKFREVTGGAFAAGALTGISANATSPDVVGWIEIVFRSGSSIQHNKTGSFVVTGDWFDLGTTTGAPGQTVQIPTNGGGAGTVCSGIQIETAPGSGVYEWYPAMATTNWLTTHIAADMRSKVVENAGSGIVRIGANSAGTPIGFTPPAGCKIRTPNVFQRTCTAGTDATTLAPATSAGSRCTVVLQGPTNIDKFCSEFATGSASSTDSLTITNTIWAGMFIFPSCNNVTITDVGVGMPVADSGSTSFTDCSNVTLTRFVNARYGTCTFAGNSNLSIVDSRFALFLSSTGSLALNINNSNNVQINNSQFIYGLSFSQSKIITVTNLDYYGNSYGATAANNGNRVVSVSACSDVLVDGVTFGNNGAVLGVYPGIFIISFGNNQNCRFRNFGSAASPLNCGTVQANSPNPAVNKAASAPDLNVKYQNIYATRFRAPFGTSASYGLDTNVVYENILADTVDSFSNGFPRNATFRSCSSAAIAQTVIGGGNFVMPYFSSDTSGYIHFQANSLTAETADYITLSLASNPLAGVRTTQQFCLPTAGDYVIIETPYFIKGFTGFANAAANTLVTGSFTYEYQLDTGSGYSGTWKVVNGANLSAEIISPTGFKMKTRVTASSSSVSNTFNYIRVQMVSTRTAQRENFFPLDTNTLTFTGLVAGSEVRCYTGSDPATAVEIGGTESSGTSFSFTHSAGGTPGFIRIFALGYQPVNYDPYTYSASDTTLLVQQTVDRNYVNPA